VLGSDCREEGDAYLADPWPFPAPGGFNPQLDHTMLSSSFPQLGKTWGGGDGGRNFGYVGFISRADAEFVGRMV
jgi:hypothetical protein